MKPTLKILIVGLIAFVMVGLNLFALDVAQATKPDLASRADSPLNEFYILIDDFKDGNWENKLGGENRCYADASGEPTCTIAATLQESYVAMAYNVITPSANVWLQMDLGESGKYGNLLSMDAVQIVLRGEQGGERVYAEFKNCGSPEESSYLKVEIGAYLAGGISTEWRATVIPFSAFTSKLSEEQRLNWSWSCIDRFSLIAHSEINSGQGKVFIDDVRTLGPIVLIDDYHDQEFENELGGASGPWSSITGTHIATPTSPFGVLVLDYNVPPGDFGGGYWTKLISTNLFLLKDYLIFEIRGEQGGEELSVEFKDCGLSGYTHYAEIKIGDYLERGVTADWQTAIIPLVAFVNPQDSLDEGFGWECIDQLTFNVSGRPQFQSGRGTVYIDNVRVAPFSALIYRLPVLVDRVYDCNSRNALNWGWYTGATNGAYFEAAPDPVHRRGDDGCGYRLAFNVKVGQSGWAWTELKGFDASRYAALEFYVQGATGAETMRLYLVDQQGREQYKTIERLSTEWQRRQIPLNDFSPVNITDLREIKFAFEEGFRQGEIYIDDISFIQPWVALPLVIKVPPATTPSMTELSVFNDNTGGDVTFSVHDPDNNITVATCTISNQATGFCASFPPGVYKVEALALCGVGASIKTYEAGPQITRVFCY